MKPPSRPRSAPARYALDRTARVWTEREKRHLLRALRAQAHSPGPLQPELLKEYLPSRDEAEIMEFVDLLKECVAKEAVKAQCRHRQQKDAPIPAPIEVWIELAGKLTGCLKDAVTAAFSQVLTIASAEPLCLLHSVPPKPIEVKNARCSSPTLHHENKKSSEQSQEAAVSLNAEGLAPAENGGFHVDFEKIYKYLSVISRGSKAPELPPGESAVLLDLLLSLPEELGCLDFKKLKSHMNKSYIELSTHYTGEKSKTKTETGQFANNSEELNDSFLPVCPATSSLPQQQEVTSTSASSKGDTAPASAMDWKTLGICPLNSFLLPLDILARKGENLD